MTFAQVYGDDQRQAIWELKGQGLSAPRVVELLANGHGELEGFSIPAHAVNRIYRAEKIRRRALDESPIARLPAGDAVDSMRVRLLTLADRELARLEHAAGARRLRPLDSERARGVARLLREVQALDKGGVGGGKASSSAADGDVEEDARRPLLERLPLPKRGDVEKVGGAVERGGELVGGGELDRPGAASTEAQDGGAPGGGRDGGADGRGRVAESDAVSELGSGPGIGALDRAYGAAGPGPGGRYPACGAG